MFGYVKAHKREMKIREYDTYCAAYCGLCRAMKKTTGQLSRLILNYDFVFLSLTRCVLAREPVSVSSHRCPVHPLKRRPMIDITPSMEFASKASVALAYYKAKDDIADSKRCNKLLHRVAFPFFKYLNRKADLPELEAVIGQKLEALSLLEQERTASLDAPAALFGELLGHTFSYGLESDAARLAYEIGYHTGKFIYVADAADDYEDDRKDGSYNPLVEMYGGELDQGRKESIQTALLCELSALECAVDLIDFSDYCDIEGIIKNIIYLGMPAQLERALFGNSDNNDSERT